MSTTGLERLDATVHKTNQWLRELMELLPTDDKHKAYLAMRAVLHTLRDRLTVAEVAGLGAQLPMLVRGLYYEGWNPSNKPLKERHRQDFLGRIQHEMASEDPAHLASA